MAFTADVLYENMNKTRKVRKRVHFCVHGANEQNSVHVHNIVNTALFTLDIDLLGVLCYALTIKTGSPVLTEVISYGNYPESNC